MSDEDLSTSERYSAANTSLVRVKWVDASSHGGPGWVDIEDAFTFARQPCPIMETVGHVLYEDEGDEGYIVLTDTLGGEECSSVHKIPYAMITERTTL